MSCHFLARSSGVACFFVFVACLLYAEPDSPGMAYYPEVRWRTSPADKQGMNGEYLNKMHDSFDQRGQIIVIRTESTMEIRKIVDIVNVTRRNDKNRVNRE